MVFQKYDETEYGKMQTTEHQGEANVWLERRFLDKPEFEKNFGILFSWDLSWTTHAEKRVKNLSKLSEASNKISPKTYPGSQGKNSTAATLFQ